MTLRWYQQFLCQFFRDNTFNKNQSNKIINIPTETLSVFSALEDC